MVGNLLEFGFVFDHAQFGTRVPPNVVEEQNVAVWRYRLFKRWFNHQYILSMEDKGLNPFYVFNRSLIDFGVALCSYANRWQKSHVLSIPSKNMTKLILGHIHKDWQDLLGSFEKALNEDPSACHWFSWRGGRFYILPRDERQVWGELFDWEANPIYTNIDQEENNSSDGDQDV